MAEEYPYMYRLQPDGTYATVGNDPPDGSDPPPPPPVARIPTPPTDSDSDSGPSHSPTHSGSVRSRSSASVHPSRGHGAPSYLNYTSSNSSDDSATTADLQRGVMTPSTSAGSLSGASTDTSSHGASPAASHGSALALSSGHDGSHGHRGPRQYTLPLPPNTRFMVMDEHGNPRVANRWTLPPSVEETHATFQGVCYIKVVDYPVALGGPVRWVPLTGMCPVCGRLSGVGGTSEPPHWSGKHS